MSSKPSDSNLPDAQAAIAVFRSPHYLRHNQRRLEHLASLGLDLHGAARGLFDGMLRRGRFESKPTSESERLNETRAFIDSLRAIGLEAGALIVNRAMPEMPSLAALSRMKIAPELKRRLRRNWKDFAALKAREAESLSALRAMIPRSARLAVVPDLGREPATLADLAAIAHHLSGVQMEDADF